MRGAFEETGFDVDLQGGERVREGVRSSDNCPQTELQTNVPRVKPVGKLKLRTRLCEYVTKE